MGVAFFEGAAGVRRGFRSVCSWCPSQNVRKGSLKVEGYAVAELAARADVVAPGLGRPVGKLVALAGELTGPGAGRRSFDEIEQKVIVQGRELLQVVLQYVMDQLAAAEPRLAQVTGADGVPRRRAERGHRRTVVTWFGPVTVRRMAYREPGAANLHPADAALSLPARRYSWQVQRAGVPPVPPGGAGPGGGAAGDLGGRQGGGDAAGGPPGRDRPQGPQAPGPGVRQAAGHRPEGRRPADRRGRRRVRRDRAG